MYDEIPPTAVMNDIIIPRSEWSMGGFSPRPAASLRSEAGGNRKVRPRSAWVPARLAKGPPHPADHIAAPFRLASFPGRSRPSEDAAGRFVPLPAAADLAEATRQCREPIVWSIRHAAECGITARARPPRDRRVPERTGATVNAPREQTHCRRDRWTF